MVQRSKIVSVIFILVSFFLSGCSKFSSGQSNQNNSSQESKWAIASVSGFSSSACDRLSSVYARGNDVTAEFQACIDSVPAGNTLALKPGIYNLKKSIYVNKKMTLTTEGAPTCSLSPTQPCAELRATADAEPEYVTGLIGVSSEGKIRNIVVNGNRQARYGSRYAELCRTGTTIAQNMKLEGNNITVDGVVIKNALCAAGVVVLPGAANLTFQNNIVAFNGTHNEELLWADGLTLIDAKNSNFLNNQFIDNTDVDLIFGGCRDCRIQGNTITHSASFANSTFAALMLHAWPSSSGDYTNTDVSNNKIDCGPQRRCGFGLLLGAEPWYSAPLFGGFVHNNTVTNALQGFHIERASGLIRIKDNIVTNSGGQTLTNVGMRAAVPYAIADRTNVQIEDIAIAASVYQTQSFSRAIANWWTSDVAWGAGSSTMTSDVRAMLQSAYVQVFKRDLDSAGFAYWSKFIQDGHSTGELVAALQNSPEGIVRGVYRSLLKREPDQAGLDYFLAKIAAGASRAQVVAEIEASAEYKGLRK